MLEEKIRHNIREAFKHSRKNIPLKFLYSWSIFNLIKKISFYFSTMFTLLNIDRNNSPKSHTAGRGRPRSSPNTISEYNNNVYIYMRQSSRRS